MRCRIIRHEKRVICDSSVAVDVVHFMVVCGEREGDRYALVDVVRINGLERWRDKFVKVGKGGFVDGKSYGGSNQTNIGGVG